jgi:integrase/recombinase XerD
MTAPDLAALLPSWERHLRAERKSPGTVQLYARGVRAFLAWTVSHKIDTVLDRPTVTAFIADLLDAGRAGNTVAARQLALRQYAKWLVAEGELGTDPLAGMRPPKLDTRVIEVLTDTQLKALVAACQGRSFQARRDEALVRVMAESGVRAGEMIALGVGDVDLDTGVLTVRRGKGGKGRRVPLGIQTIRSIDRYLRLRRGHRLAGTPALWLGAGGKSFGYYALYAALRARAERAGIPSFTPHQLRHTFAARWLAAEGSEGGLLTVAGWSKREMISRYIQAVREDLAGEEAKRLGLGDL